jgi:hypothetical protein
VDTGFYIDLRKWAVKLKFVPSGIVAVREVFNTSTILAFASCEHAHVTAL